MSQNTNRRWWVAPRELLRVVVLAVPVVALALFAANSLALLSATQAAPAVPFRSLDAAAFAAIEQSHTPSARPAGEEADEIDVANWENTQGGGNGSGKKF